MLRQAELLCTQVLVNVCGLENQHHQSENSVVVLLIVKAGCHGLLMLQIFILYGKDAESKAIPMSKHQHRGHESRSI